ncbi:Ubiquitin carboxyl-terminal hydrolase 34 [Rhizoctonia solani]|uniref:Ubiquitin carboxyl-terminal hydrolase 34 n=1 Tax=Rhizoctonia solani TaxID=456999 RepID=A0A0K6FWX8_9AGAM|nr:Ubiquitin carboxyl-terminal hydrolase 34 [Rhizoctonia solani]
MENEVPVNGLNLVHYSHKQLADLLDEKEERLKKYRLRGLEVNRKATRLLGKLSDHRQLLFALAEVDDVSVSRIVRVALSQGCGPAAIVNRLTEAQQHLYRCQSYSKKDIDIGLLSLRLGGPRLLEILSKALNLPSLSTIYRHAERLHIKPSLAFPTESEVLANIKTVCGHAQAMKPSTRGFSLLIDEIALEERVRYSLADDTLVGFCRECTPPGRLRSMTGRPVSDLYDLKKSLDSGECHRAKEATVMAIAPFSADHYTPMVIVVSGTCKTETVDRQLALLKLGYNAYKKSPHGALALGPIWSIETDGDAGQRLALFRLCTSYVVPPLSELYLELHPLELMNLECGEDQITHDGDFKHEEKRLASALRSKNGMVINGTHLSHAHVKQLLRLDSAISCDRLDALFDNSDRQSVPKAHTLLKGIYNISQLPDIQKQPGHKPIVLLGELIHAFIAPYTTPSMSLSQQVVCLTKCAFLLFALFRLDGTSFITAQLYYDIQTTIKTAIFSIAKAQILDHQQPFYLIQLGTDRLENLFGIYRTASHDRNLDILQLAERSGAAQEVDNILAEYPNYDRKPYRLSLKSESGVDHLNPRSWTGDVCVCNVVLSKSWSAGRIEAEEALRRAGITPDFDPKSLCASAGGLPVDLMRPFGHYVGVNESIPDELDEGDPTPSSGPMPVISNSAPTEPVAPTEPSHFSASDFMDIELETPLENLLAPPSMPPGTSEHEIILTSEGPLKRGWLKVEGHHVRLESATRLILGSTSTEKSTDRLRRVRGYTQYPSASKSDSILGDFCLIGQPILGLVRVDDAIALAAARVVSIQIGTSRDPVEALSLDHLNRSDVILTGQILKLDFSFDDRAWYWNQSYITSPASKKGKQSIAMNEKPLLVQFRSHTIELTNPTISEHLGQLVWSFEHDGLIAAMDLLWSKCSETLHEIPVYSELFDFPYHWDNDGQSLLVHNGASQAIELMPSEKCGMCYLCHHTVPIKKCMRTHIGKHILAKRLQKEDPLLADGTTMVNYAPCGFCG